MTRRDRQRGVAVLIAMLAVTIGTIIAVNLMWQGTLDLRRAEAALAMDQSMLYVQGAEAWAADILRQDMVDSPESDNLGELWATPLPPLPVDGGTIQGKLEDLQGRFNLNDLINDRGLPDPIALKQFERLLSLLEIDPNLAGGVLDWLDPDTDVRFPNGGEDTTYAAADPPYRTANTLITTPTELMAVTGFDRKTYATLAPYITALPRGTKLNVNTAADVVIASLSDMIDLSTAKALVEERGNKEFVDLKGTFMGLVDRDTLKRIDGVSEHFLLTATVTLGTNQMTMRSVLQRDRSGLTRALFRSLGIE
ncbi:MAG TPA: type II secretion system minor pseudopilin GspK [Gammaproteobacteria bacterium]|nr:type II secretion system minor pseudopilin GspK [Gammaproteobacteria bacterium]